MRNQRIRNLLYPDLQESTVTQAEANTRATHIENKFLDKGELNSSICPPKSLLFTMVKKNLG